jgi:hypothetical protein
MLLNRLGLIRTPKERLGAVILDVLRLVAPAAGYHFQECPGNSYQLTLYWGSRCMNMTFTEEQARSANTEQGKNLVASQLSNALLALTNSKTFRQAS